MLVHGVALCISVSGVSAVARIAPAVNPPSRNITIMLPKKKKQQKQ